MAMGMKVGPTAGRFTGKKGKYAELICLEGAPQGCGGGAKLALFGISPPSAYGVSCRARTGGFMPYRFARIRPQDWVPRFSGWEPENSAFGQNYQANLCLFTLFAGNVNRIGAAGRGGF